MIKCVLKGTKIQYSAVGEYSDKKLKVLKGSKISERTSDFKMSEEAFKARENSELVENYVVLEDIVFSSPSSAAQFVAGYSVNGLNAWRDINTGKSLKEVR